MIRAQALELSYPAGEGPALRGVDVDLASGRVLGVVGAAGAGKTSLCWLLAGLAPRNTGGSSRGALRVAGVDPRTSDVFDVTRRVGLVFEDHASQLTQTTVLGEVMAPLTNRGSRPQDARVRARHLLDWLGLGDVDADHKRTWELSGGQQQRLAIAAALSCEPDVLVLDNVTGLLDPVGRERVRRLVADLTPDTTVVVVEHDLDVLTDLADQLLVLRDGMPAAYGAASELLRRARLLQDAAVEPPTVVRVAQATGLDTEPLTVDELVDAMGLPATQPPQPGLQATAARNDPSVAPAVDVREVGLTYPDGTAALTKVSMRIPQGSVHAVVGANGAGKSTLLRLLCGLTRPSTGTVTIAGRDTREHSPAELARTVGTALQNPDEQITERTVRAEIEHPLRLRRTRRHRLRRGNGLGEPAIRAAAERAQAMVGLPDSLMGEDPTQLSRGHRKLVTIASALVLQPSVLLLDEPAAALDYPARTALHRLLRRLQDAGVTVILVEHDLDLVAETADHVTVLNGGRPWLTGTPHEVLSTDMAELLHQASLRPSRAARVAVEIGVEALTVEEIATQVAPMPQEA